MSCADDAIQKTLDNEGKDLVENDDGRGPSKWGITWKTAQVFFTQDDIRNLTREQAAAWYRANIWDHYQLDRILDCGVASKVFDLAVNIGPGTAFGQLQRCLNAFMGANLTVDGILGPATISEINTADPNLLLADYKQTVLLYYDLLVRKNPALASDLPGWTARLHG